MNNYKVGDIVVATKENSLYLEGQVGVVKGFAYDGGYPRVVFDTERRVHTYDWDEIEPYVIETVGHEEDSGPLVDELIASLEEEISAPGVHEFIPEGKPVDMVNKPDHYNHGEIECIDYLKDNMPYEAYLGYLEGNLKKYLHRWRHKGKPLEDLKKANWYLNRLRQELEGPEKT
jgi:hypothetical protein